MEVTWLNVFVTRDTGCVVWISSILSLVTEENEFIVGDLRSPGFVNSILEFKGYLGNYYKSVPNRLIESFDEIYQFAFDMGGAGFVFTGENDAEIMHNSVTINLNVLEGQRQLNETFDGVEN